MRFDEPDVREAYRRGAQDCFESLGDHLNARQVRAIESWLQELVAWEGTDEPLPSTPLIR